MTLRDVHDRCIQQRLVLQMVGVAEFHRNGEYRWEKIQRDPHLPELLDAVRRFSESEVWYWVTPVDNPDALGDYGGFTFQTYDEAKQFIESEYKEYARLRDDEDYYEADSTPDLLQIETVVTVKTEVIDAVSESSNEP